MLLGPTASSERLSNVPIAGVKKAHLVRMLAAVWRGIGEPRCSRGATFLSP
jgi:hypothetical protein